MMADNESEMGTDLAAKKEKKGPTSSFNGLSYIRPKSEYISPTGISTLDIRTRLRITEAELAIVQREFSDLNAEKNSLESDLKKYEDSWKFAVQELGRVVEQRDDAMKKLEQLERVEKTVQQEAWLIDNKKISHQQSTKKKTRVPRSELEQCQISLETQIRVCKTLEAERDRAYDNCQEAQAQLRTLMQQYHELVSTCAEIARERDKSYVEANLLRVEFHRYVSDVENPIVKDSQKEDIQSVHSGTSDLPSADHALCKQQLKKLSEEKDTLQMMYEQAMKGAEQYQKQLQRADEERRHALATSEALAALWQKKFENAQNENRQLQNENEEFRQELRSYHDRISHLQDRLAESRLQLHGDMEDMTYFIDDDIPMYPVLPQHTPSPDDDHGGGGWI